MTAIRLKHNIEEIDISLGRYAYETKWRNKKWSWEKFVNRISEAHYTHETHDEYMAMKKPLQDKIKDVGGYVGGYLTNGRRGAKNVLHRQLIALDLDFAPKDFDAALELTWGNAYAIYSTHKHTPKNPRLRLIMPLDRPVAADEYEAIARKIAGELEIEWFDPTTFQPERLMFWPSTSSDGEYEFSYLDAPPLIADDILDMYTDWTDSSEWPVSEKVDGIIRRLQKKQDDPLEKDNVVGAFCRTYPISEAINEFLEDVYSEGTEGRYTFLEGSTANGLVTYEDKWAFSHHGTDPISGKLCNAFDLVRVHLYGLQDENAKEDTPGTRLPSYKSMIDLAIKDKRVKKLLGKERLQKAREDFAPYITNDDEQPIKKSKREPEIYDEEEPVKSKKNKHINDVKDAVDELDEQNIDWTEKLEIDKQGHCLSTIQNVAIILENDPQLKGKFRYNGFTGRKEITKRLPWRKVDHTNNFIRDDDEQNLNKYLEKYYNITTRANIKDAFDTHFAANTYHPVREYFAGLPEWDEENRLDYLLIDYLGVEDTDYVRAVTRKTFVAAVARIFNPGCKFDHVLTLTGEEGRGKSTLINKMGMAWYSNSFNFSMLRSKEAYEQLQGVWIMELAELVGLRKAEAEAAKNFIDKRIDIYRVAYGRNTMPFKRQNIFIGTTNNFDFLQKGVNGHRRWWPVEIMQTKPVKNVFKGLTKDEVNQLWAEAIYYYEEGEKLFLSEELEKIAKKMQQHHTEVDERTGMVHRYLDTLLPIDWKQMPLYEKQAFLRGQNVDEERTGVVVRNRVCVGEIWTECLGGNYQTITRMNTKEIHDIMRSLKDWEPYKNKTDFPVFGTQRGYFRKEDYGSKSGQKTAVTIFKKDLHKN